MKKVIRIFVLALILFAVGFTLIKLWKRSKPVEIQYESYTVDSGSIVNTTLATGNVNPRDEIFIKPQIAGIISQIEKKPGDQIAVGEVIAVVKIVPDVASINGAESRIKIASINLEQIRSIYERQKQLFQKGVIPKEEIDEAESNYNKALDELETAKSSLDIMMTGVTKKMSKYSNTQIRSTIAGKILDIPVKVGSSVMQANNFNEGTTVASIANMNDIIFTGFVDETEVGKIHVGMDLKITVGALSDIQFDAKLEYISPKGVDQSGAKLFEIKAAVLVPQNVEMRAGYSANAEIILSQKKDVLVIPESLVTFADKKSYVYVLDKKNPSKSTYIMKEIETGLSNGILLEVKSGLSKGDKIRGKVKLNDMPVKGTTVMVAA